MKKESSSFKYIKTERGFMLITILMVLAVITIFGISLLTITASNFKQTGVERNFQSVYYIAEAGINNVIYDIGIKVDELSSEELSHEDFFDELNKFIVEYMEDGVKILDNFEESFGEKPVAEITIEDDDIGMVIVDEATQTKGTTSYIIESVGKIGGLRRTVTTSIEVGHGIEKEKGTSRHPAFDYVLYSPKALSLPNQSKIDGSIYSKDIVLNHSGIAINGNIISETFLDIKMSTVKGDVFALDGKVDVTSTGGTVLVEGNVNANGNVIIGSQGTVLKNVYSLGDIITKYGSPKVVGNLHASRNIELMGGSFIGQNVFANGDFKLVDNGSTVQGDIFAGNNIYLVNNPQIFGNSYAGGAINEHKATNVNIEIHPNNRAMKPIFPITEKIMPPTLSNFSPDITKDISVPQSSSNFVIEPGTYGNLFVGGASTLTFKSGNYIFNSIDGARWGQSLRLDLSNGPINIYSKNDIKYAGPVFITENGVDWTRIDNLDKERLIRLAGKVYWETYGNFILSNDASPRQWFGSVYANNITVGDNFYLVGAFTTRTGDTKMGNAPQIIYAPPTDSAAGSSSSTGGSGSPNNKGQNAISPKNRISTSSPIREK